MHQVLCIPYLKKTLPLPHQLPDLHCSWSEGGVLQTRNLGRRYERRWWDLQGHTPAASPDHNLLALPAAIFHHCSPVLSAVSPKGLEEVSTFKIVLIPVIVTAARTTLTCDSNCQNCHMTVAEQIYIKLTDPNFTRIKFNSLPISVKLMRNNKRKSNIAWHCHW